MKLQQDYVKKRVKQFVASLKLECALPRLQTGLCSSATHYEMPLGPFTGYDSIFGKEYTGWFQVSWKRSLLEFAMWGNAPSCNLRYLTIHESP